VENYAPPGCSGEGIFLTEKSRLREDGFSPPDERIRDVLNPKPCMKEVISRRLVAAETRSAKSPGRWLSRGARNETQSLEIP